MWIFKGIIYSHLWMWTLYSYSWIWIIYSYLWMCTTLPQTFCTNCWTSLHGRCRPLPSKVEELPVTPSRTGVVKMLKELLFCEMPGHCCWTPPRNHHSLSGLVKMGTNHCVLAWRRRGAPCGPKVPLSRLWIQETRSVNNHSSVPGAAGAVSNDVTSGDQVPRSPTSGVRVRSSQEKNISLSVPVPLSRVLRVPKFFPLSAQYPRTLSLAGSRDDLIEDNDSRRKRFQSSTCLLFLSKNNEPEGRTIESHERPDDQDKQLALMALWRQWEQSLFRYLDALR